jgi:hypothetical protein
MDTDEHGFNSAALVAPTRHAEIGLVALKSDESG